MKLTTAIVGAAFFSANVCAESYLLAGGGVTGSLLTNTDTVAVKKTMRKGYNAGLAFEQSFAGRFSFLTGFWFETRGQTEERTIARTNGTESNRQNVNMLYGAIPLLVQLNLPVGRLRYDVFAGPELGIFLSAEKKITVNTQLQTGVLTQNDTINFSKDVNMLDAGMTAGLGCEMTIGPGAIFVKPGYYFGVTDFLNKERAEKNGTSPKGTHQAISIKVGYKFAGM
jgi:hypothetical protein